MFRYVVALSYIYTVDLLAQNRYKQLLRALQQWRDLKNCMKSGLGHEAEENIPKDGCMAIFCPACPQPGVNLPTNWKTKYSSYVCKLGLTLCDNICDYSNELIRTFIMDGNFSAEHMCYRSTDKDVALSPGMAFMSNPELYKSHLQSGAEMIQASICLSLFNHI
jgi:hypothetical protein